LPVPEIQRGANHGIRRFVPLAWEPGVPLVRGRLAALLLAAIPLSVAGCSAPSASVAQRPGGLHVTCADTVSDAGRLQHAIDTSQPHAVIEISGTCLLDHGIVLLANRTYTGDGRTATVLRQDAPMAYVMASAGYVRNGSTTGAPLTIEQLTVSCTGQGRTNGIVVLNWQVEVQQADVTNCGGSGIVDTSQTANGGSITNTSVNSRFSDNFITGSGADGFEVIDNRNAVTDGYLTDNQIASSGKAAVAMENAAGWNISGNHLYNDAGNGIVAGRLFGTTISGNFIEDFASRQASGTWYGITGSVQEGDGSTIFGNSVFNDLGERGGATHVYIAILKVNSGIGRVAVTGNVIAGAARTDVALSFDAGAHHLVVASSGNVISGVGTLTQHSGTVRISSGN
jgi:hypothetical protein